MSRTPDLWLVGRLLTVAKRPPSCLPEDARHALLVGANVAVLTVSGELWAGRVCEQVGALRLLPFGAAESRVFDFDQLVGAHVLGNHSWSQRKTIAATQARGEPARRLEMGEPPKPKPTARRRRRSKAADLAVSALDAAVRDYRRHAQSFSASAWDMGRVLLGIRDRELYRARHESWERFLEAELDCSREWAAAMMRVAREFDRDQVRRIGPSRLDVVRRAPRGDRERLLRDAEQGATVDQLKASLPAGTRDKPGRTPRPNPTPEQARKRASRRRELERAKAERGPTEREIAAQIVALARPFLSFDRVVELAGVDLPDDALTELRDELSERLDVEVRRAVVASVRSLRRAASASDDYVPAAPH
ncbi:MAG: hypothetical protein RIF41_40250 [Polyangiaceae bacterium]